MSDERKPRPEYGEYATPEEQRAAIQQPVDYSHSSSVEGQEHVTGPSGHQPAQPGAYGAPDAQHQQQLQPGQSGGPGQPGWPGQPGRKQGLGGLPRQRSGMGDRVATFALLGVGLLDVLNAVGTAGSYGDYLVSIAQTAGLNGLKASEVPGWLGYAIAVFDVLLWVSALGLSIRSLRRGRLSFWIPLAAGGLAGVVTAVAAAIVLLTSGDIPGMLGGVNSPPPSSGSDT